MGNKKASVRTLPTGEKVRHEPPDEQHPEGKQTLIQERSALRDALEARRADNRAAHSVLQQRNTDKLRARQARLAEHPAVPPEKRPV